jgi:hypothetical protein
MLPNVGRIEMLYGRNNVFVPQKCPKTIKMS